MRTDKKVLNIADGEGTAVVRSRKFNITWIFLGVLPFLTVFIILLLGLIISWDVIDIFKIGIMVFLLTTALMFFLRSQDSILNIKYSKSFIMFFYLLAILLIMLQNDPVIYSFWMISGLLISMLFDNKLGLMVYFSHAFILSVAYSLRPEAIIHILIIGILFYLLSAALRNKSTVIYAGIIILSSNLTLSLIMNNFIIESTTSINYLASLFSLLAVLASSFLISYIYDRILARHTLASEPTSDQLDTDELEQACSEDIQIDADSQEDQQIVIAGKDMRASYDLLLSKDNELLLRIKDYSEALYKHSELIGDLSGRAAKIIGGNQELAIAGGYYHEVGKINGKNYIEEGLSLAEKYAFPEELKLILKQHNIKYEKPTSIEAAIVMISDNVVSTIEYVKKSSDQKLSPDKVIDNIFKMRMEKGNFDDSGLSVKDFKLLKEFYQSEYKTEAMED